VSFPLKTKWLLANEYMDNRDNGYADYNTQTVVVGVFYMVLPKLIHSRVETGSNTSLRDVGGDEKGSLESETVKYDQETRGIRIRK
jgi:hypothetical protein